MQKKPDMLDYVKAMSDPKRLQIIGLLSQRPATREQVASELGLTPKDSLTHLGFLEYVGAVKLSDGVFSLSEERPAAFALENFKEERAAFAPPADLDEKSQKVLRAHLRADGSIRQIPAAPKLQVILNYLAGFFEFERDYTEREVNEVIRRFHEDTAGLRRDLIEAHLLARISDGSRYWRVRHE